MASAEAVLVEILNARRLLSDHVDIVAVTLEQQHHAGRPRTAGPGVLQRSAPSVAAAATTLCAISSCIVRWKPIPRLAVPVSLVTLGLSYYWGQWWYRQRMTSNRMAQLKRFLCRLDAFDVVIRRNLKIVRESSRLSEERSGACSEMSLHMKCVQSEIDVIRALVAALDALEQQPLPYELLDIYQPLESLDDCELFQQPIKSLNPMHIKDFHQIFQYVQSQLLTRICLAAVHSPDAARFFMDRTLPELSSLIDVQLRIDGEVQQSLTDSLDIQSRLNDRRSIYIGKADPTITQLRGLSLDVIARFLAIADRMRRLDEIIQTENEIDSNVIRSQSSPMDQIEMSLGECVDDYRRLVLSYNRLVHGKCAEALPLGPAATVEANAAEPCTFNEADLSEEPDAEFYALLERDPNEEEENSKKSKENNRTSLDDELQVLHSRVVKRHFKPVLVQLKDRLEPINTAMRDRERKFLQDKGIDAALPSVGHATNGSDDDDDELDEFGRLRRKKPVDNYDEVRRFLEAKQPISLMPMRGGAVGGLPPPRRMIEEEILE